MALRKQIPAARGGEARWSGFKVCSREGGQGQDRGGGLALAMLALPALSVSARLGGPASARAASARVAHPGLGGERGGSRPDARGHPPPPPPPEKHTN